MEADPRGTLLCATTTHATGIAPASAQKRYAATTTQVVDGDTVDAQLTGGPRVGVRLIGIDAPEAVDRSR